MGRPRININERIGLENLTKYGTKMIIVEYYSCNNIIVEFQDEYKTRVSASYQTFKNSEIHNPYDKTLCGVGYLGIGKHQTKESGKDSKKYITWKAMIQRCYDENFQIKNPTYKNCSVCDKWHNFQNFGDWFDENFYQVEEEIMCLDKDIIMKGNKIYCPEYCCFLPKSINSSFIGKKRSNTNSLLGVVYLEKDDVYQVQCKTINGKRTYLGRFKDKQEAFSVYLSERYKTIRQYIDKYNNYLPNKIKSALLNYEFDMED